MISEHVKKLIKSRNLGKGFETILMTTGKKSTARATVCKLKIKKPRDFELLM